VSPWFNGFRGDIAGYRTICGARAILLQETGSGSTCASAQDSGPALGFRGSRATVIMRMKWSRSTGSGCSTSELFTTRGLPIGSLHRKNQPGRQVPGKEICLLILQCIDSSIRNSLRNRSPQSLPGRCPDRNVHPDSRTFWPGYR
jgi:hypothetical protein